MNALLTGTYSMLVFPIPNEVKYYSYFLHQHQTGDSFFELNYFPLTMETDLTNGAHAVLDQIRNIKLVEEARKILFLIQKVIKKFQQFGLELSYLPQIHAFSVDDGSILLEWIFPDFRIGFSIEQNNSESGWYLVTRKKLGEISASGNLADVDTQGVVIWLIDFVLANA